MPPEIAGGSSVGVITAILYGDLEMHPLQWEYRPDRLRAPALVCAFKGWNDAADAASTALTFVGSTLAARRFATIDPEEFYDFQAARPQVKLVDGHARRGEPRQPRGTA